MSRSVPNPTTSSVVRLDPETGLLVDRRKLAALRKLSVSLKALTTAPPIGDHFDRFAWRRQRAGHPTCWTYYLRMSEAPEAKAILEKVLLLGEDARSRVPMEAFAISAGVNPWRLYECLTGAAMRAEAQTGTFLIAVNQEDILAALIERAKDLSPDGDRAREQFLRMSGYMPMPKSAQTNITVVQQNATGMPVASSAIVAAPQPEDITRGLASDYQAAHPALPTPIIDVDVEDPQDDFAGETIEAR